MTDESSCGTARPGRVVPLDNPNFADMTTMRVGGPVGTYVEASSEKELIDTVRAADNDGTPLLVIGGGSNLVVADEGFDGIVVRDARTGLRRHSEDACGGANFCAVAGQDFDELVSIAIDEEWVGIEALSGIPGTVGAAPVQNIGAYGQEVATSIASVRTWDRMQGRVRMFAFGNLRFGYRTSLLKQTMYSQPSEVDPRAPWFPSPRYIVLDASFQTRLGRLSAPIGYGELARNLGVDVGRRAPMTDVRQAVLALRTGKGMVIDGGGLGSVDHDRWSAGSFFTNPIVEAAHADRLLPPDAPRYPVRTAIPEVSTGPSLGTIDPNLVKTSAAWLIEHAGFGKGYGVDGEHSPARLSSKHTLALTNRGGALASDIMALARTVRDGVRDRYGITLEPEPILVGLAL
ncbi:MAG: UDP-N-acetylmuramate dehydrogenase [Cellulomonadaceae bacterium]|jgi:UDP-N-acetylmuramate dehydrogenase|nr:UDP-N-acetylmuramate dehydrogenase [Cellulomonadaceae bacterium]